MKKEALNLFIGEEVTIRFSDGDVYRGLLLVDDYRKNGYTLHGNDYNISFKASHVKGIGNAEN